MNFGRLKPEFLGRKSSFAYGLTSACLLGRGALLIGVASIVAVPAVALAQAAPSASRVAPETLAPLHTEPDGSITLPEQSTATAPPGSENLSVRVGGVVIEGMGSPADTPPAAATAIVAERSGLAGRTVTVAELYAAAGRMEASYARAGYVLTRVTLPPQHLSDGGAVRFQIVEGFIESVDVSQLAGPVRNIVRRRLAHLVGIRGLMLAQIERRVLLAGDVPGISLRSALVRGEAIGATRLVVSGQYHAVSGGLSFDNNLGYAYQYEAFGAQLAVNSVLGLGEQIYASVTNGPDFDHLFDRAAHRRVLGGGAILPIGDDGLTLNPEYTEVDTSPRSGPGTAQVTGRYERFVVRANYPLIRTRRENLTVSGGFELDNETETANSFGTVGELNHDRLRIFNAGATYARSLGDTATVNADGQVSIGVSGLGARTKADATASGIPLSRQGSEPDFRKADIHLRLDDQVGDGFDLSAMIRGQASFTGALPAAAEFSLDGTDALSAFSLGSINADSGVTGRLELSRPFASGGAWKALITPYGFAAVGYGHLYDVTAVEVANLHSWSAGGGLRLLFSPGPGGLATTGSVEVSHGHVTAAPGTPVVSTQSTDPTRVTVSVGLHF